MLIAASVFALSMFGGDPAHARAIPVDSTSATRACITPTRTGTFRLLALSKKGNEPNTAILMLENIQGCLEVTFVADGNGPAIIDHVSVTGDTLEGSLRLSTGTAAVSFKFSDKEIAGSIVQGRREWRVEGRKTS
jgi:hypothetical protein